jgi:hypothetical protein
MSYIGNCNKNVECIYGKFSIVEGEDVPMLIAVKFPQSVTVIENQPEPDQLEEVSTPEPIKNEEITEPTKNERKSKQ